MDDTLIWIRFAAMFVVFAGSCTGLGCLAGYLVGRRGWPTWVIGFASVAVGLMWPAIVVGAAVYGARHYQPRYEGDPADAPAMVLVSAITVGVPILFAIGFPLSLTGALIARRKVQAD